MPTQHASSIPSDSSRSFETRRNVPVVSALRRRGLRGVALLALGAAAGLGGCTGALNRADGLIGCDVPDLAGRMPGALPADETASLQGLDRSGWTKTVVRVERRQTEAQPFYTTERHYDHSTARERGEWPNPTSALEVSGDSGAAALEGVAAPFNAAWDLVAMPVRMFITPPWSTVRVPQQPPSLSPSVGGQPAGGASPATAGNANGTSGPAGS